VASASANSVNGFGTQLYFRGGRQADGSFVTTKFLVLAYLPLIPLASFRVNDLRSAAGARTSSQTATAAQPVRLDLLQTIAGVAVLLACLAILAAWTAFAG
jgi:hypothetical protein